MNKNRWPWKKLTAKDEVAFRNYARANYRPGESIDPLWHPVAQHECAVMLVEMHDEIWADEQE